MDVNLLRAMAMDFAGELIDSGFNIRNIILFGSVARGDANQESDIDIFIDVPKKTKTLEKQINKTLNKFLSGKKFEKWKLRGIDNEISLIIDNLKSKKWESLRRSIISNGIVLYGKYKEKPEGLKQMMMFSYGKIKNDKKRVNIYRKIFGYKANGKKYPGLIEKLDGKKIGPGTFVIPIEGYKSVLKIFRKMKINVKIYEIWMD